MDVQVAIVGNGVAGYACAARLAKAGTRPTLIGPGLPTDRPPLSKAALRTGSPRLFADEERLATAGIDRIEGVVVGVDVAARRLRVVARDGEQDIVAGSIVFATGLSYAPPPVPGLEHAYVNATPSEIGRLMERLHTPKRILIVGAGLVGVETAATLRGEGHDVTIVDMLDRPLDRLHDPLPAVAAAALADAGVLFLGGVRIERVATAQDGHGPVSIETASHGTIEGDLVIAATGGRLVAPPGLEHLTLPVEVELGMRVPGLSDVYAVGDLCAPEHVRFGKIVFPRWDQAIGTGEAAADAILGEPSPYSRLPYWWSDVGKLRVAEFGLEELAVAWEDDGELYVGRDETGEVVCALVIGNPRRAGEAMRLVQPL